MKIICIGRNYAEHAKELNNPIPDAPVVFMKPSTALLIDEKPFYYPEFSNEVQYEAELVVKIGKNGKYVQPEFALEYCEAISVGLDLTARDIQQKCKDQRHPWELAKAFDHSAVLGTFVPLVGDIRDVRFSLKKNGVEVQKGWTGDMLFGFSDIVVYTSQYFKLQMGDLIFTGTPEGVGPIAIGDIFEGFIGEKKVLHCEVK